MHMKNKARAVLGVMAASVMLTGCWEEPTVTLHKPGEYKGSPDPLLNQQASARSEQLQKRFELVQMDR
jgi:uncharacterized lipoprotein YajG